MRDIVDRSHQSLAKGLPNVYELSGRTASEAGGAASGPGGRRGECGRKQPEGHTAVQRVSAPEAATVTASCAWSVCLDAWVHQEISALTTTKPWSGYGLTSGRVGPAPV